MSATPLIVLYRLFWNFAKTFLSLFPHCELTHFSPSIYRKWVPLVSASPLTVLYRSFWNFKYVFFIVWGCACGLDLIVRLFLLLFPHCELSHFAPFIYKQLLPLVSATPPTVLYRLLWNFVCIFLWYENVHVVWIYIVRSFFETFSTLWT